MNTKLNKTWRESSGPLGRELGYALEAVLHKMLYSQMSRGVKNIKLPNKVISYVNTY
jgi:hypothetical protein